MSMTSKFVNWLPKSPRLSIIRFLFSQKHMFGGKVQHLPERKRNFFNSVKDKGKIQVADKVTGNLTTFQEQDQSEKLLSNAFRKMCKSPLTKQPALCRSVPLSRVQLEQYFVLKIRLWN